MEIQFFLACVVFQNGWGGKDKYLIFNIGDLKSSFVLIYVNNLVEFYSAGIKYNFGYCNFFYDTKSNHIFCIILSPAMSSFGHFHSKVFDIIISFVTKSSILFILNLL